MQAAELKESEPPPSLGQLLVELAYELAQVGLLA